MFTNSGEVRVCLRVLGGRKSFGVSGREKNIEKSYFFLWCAFIDNDKLIFLIYMFLI